MSSSVLAYAYYAMRGTSFFSNDWPYRLFSFTSSILIDKGTGLFVSIHRELQHEEHLQMMSGERSAGGHHEVGGNNG